jgi:diketogulonate reductase-like aldo/keto reductase
MIDSKVPAPVDNAVVRLNSGHSVPAICFGGGMRIKDGRVFEAGLEAGFRFFDTAFNYRNDHLLFDSEIGRRLIADQRDSIAVCTKNTLLHTLPDAAHEALGRMGLEYIDLLLLHHPFKPGTEDPLGLLASVWSAMEQLADAGLVRSIGLSNTGAGLLRFILDYCRIPPAVDQVEFHPYLYDRDLLATCEAAGIRLQAYCPLGSPWRQEALGKPAPTEDPVVTGVAAARGKSASQVILRWLIEKGVIPVVSATKPEHMRENLEVFDFELTPAEHDALDNLGRTDRIWLDEAKLGGLFGTIENGELKVPGEWPR